MRPRSTPFAGAVALVVLLLVGCGPEPIGTPWSSTTDPTVDRPGTDTGGEADTDADTDSDSDTDSDTDGDADADCPTVGVYGDPDWSLEVRSDCSAFLEGFCGEGEIGHLGLVAGAFSVDFIWSWQGGGPSGGDDPAVLSGTVKGDVVEGVLAWADVTRTVRAELGVTPGSPLGLDDCPLD
jgi:hypothetical protein